MEINKMLKSFDAFVGNQADNRAAEIGESGKISNATQTSNAFMRFLNLTDGAREAKEINNKVRDAFISALKDQFKVSDVASLPASVKAALIGSHASSAEGDFAFDAEGHSTSGKPLTARRISAVMTAVKDLKADEDAVLDSQRAAVKDQKLSTATLTARTEALAPHIEHLFQRLTEEQEGYECPVFVIKPMSDMTEAQVAGKANLLKTALKMNVLPNLAKIGHQRTLADVRAKFHSYLESCGVIVRYWNQQSESGVRRFDEFADRLFDELIRNFNAQNPTLALGDELPPSERA